MTLRPEFLCRVDEIPDGGARVVPGGDDKVGIILVRRQNEVWAYRNVCPHFSIRLDYTPGTIHTYRAKVLMCAHHSALFRFEDGLCIDGPCAKASLDAVPVYIDAVNDEVCLVTPSTA
jgi:nitrite reductase/ring-hydroxylating ferredoxin subunit